MARKTRGRQKLAMKRIENETSRMVSFSKRRGGVFKKASELSTLCGIEIVIVVFSPGQRAFSFGHPSVEHVISRFYYGRQQTNLPPTSPTTQFIESQRTAKLEEFGLQLTQVLEHVEMGKKREVELGQITRANRNKTLIDTPLKKLDLRQLLQLKASLEQLKAQVVNEARIKAQAHALAQAHFNQAQAQADHERLQQQHLYLMNQIVAVPPEPRLHLEAPSAGHLEFYQRRVNNNNTSSGDDGGQIDDDDSRIVVANEIRRFENCRI